MKTSHYIIPVLILLPLATLPVTAQDIYSQSYIGTGTADGGGSGGTGISSVVVGNDASGDISFTINSSQPESAYVNYMIEIQQVGVGASGYTGFANPWGPSVGISSGMNALINTWTGGTGATAFAYSGGWSGGVGTAFAGGVGTTSATITTTLANLGLAPGGSFYFDVVSSFDTPGGQSAYGALDNPGGYPAESDNNYTPWNGTSYYDSVPGPSNGGNSIFGTAASEYTVAVPEPATCVLMGMGALAMIRRSLKKIKN
ncbi:MAG: PEP-CTERM sorting domain-containing protein [Verrucomicrobiota bacterium]|jgi:hypothetical protein